MSPRITGVGNSIVPKQIKIKLNNSANSGIIGISSKILDAAKSRQCDEIKLVPEPQRLVAQLLKKGKMSHWVEVPKNLESPIVARLKILGNMSIAEHKVRQEGNIIHRGILHSAETLPSELGEGMKIKLLGYFKKLGW